MDQFPENSSVPKPLPSCPLCSCSLDNQSFRALVGYEKDHLVRCLRCGFNFSLLDPTPADYARVYGAYDYVGEDAARTPLSIKKERAIAERLSKYRKTGNVLDMAAGAGRFLQHFKDLGFNCHATEFNEEMCQYLERKGFTTYRGGLFPQGAQHHSFDVVIFTEIIEHINNPAPVLLEIARLLRPGGCLYLTTPNFASLERRIIGPSWGMLMWPEHITYWTPRHIDHALTGAGLEREILSTENISPYRLVQALKRGRLEGALASVSETRVSDAAQQAAAGNPLLRAAKVAVNGLLSATGTGSSIQAYYRRPLA